MTDDLLWWLLLPALAGLAIARPAERGPVVARVVVLAFALGTLLAGVGGLATAELRGYAQASPGGALFVSLSTGMLLGGMLPWPPRGWRAWIGAAPLAVAGLVIAWPALRAGPYLLGAVLAAVPTLLGDAFPSRSAVLAMSRDPVAHRRAGWLVLVLALAVSLAGSLGAMLLAPICGLVVGLIVRRSLPRGRGQLVLPAVAAVASLLLAWLALTIAGDALAEAATFFTSAPVSPAAERWLALLGVVVVLAMLAPWPLGRFGLGMAMAPAAAVLAYRVSLSVAPAALGDWLPLLGMLLVPLAVLAALGGRWPEALVIASVLAALRPGGFAIAGAVAALGAALAITASSGGRNILRPGRVTFAGAWWLAALAAIGCGAAALALLAHEVVLATLLTGGLALAAARVRPADA